MGNLRQRAAVLISISLIAVGCGGGDEATPPTTTISDETTDATSAASAQSSPDGDNQLTSEACAALDAEQPPDDLAELVPSAYAQPAQLLLDLSASFDPNESMSSDLIDRLAEPTVSTTFSSFADSVERDCGPGQAGEGIRAYADMTQLAAVGAIDDYCRQLEVALSLDAGDASSASALEAAIDLAPDEHGEALATLRALMSSENGDFPDEIDPTRIFATNAGLGLYAEARCGVTGAFTTMLFAAAFLSLAAGADGSGATAVTGLGATPPPADPASAVTALPATSNMAFETIELDLEDDRDYLVSAVVPAGWQRAETMFGAVFEPPEGFGFFTELTFDTGCDGLCEATDWGARLNGDDGFVTNYRASGDLIIDRPTEGTPGVVMTKPGVSEGIEGRVIRWDDATDRYFVCDFRLDGDDIGLLDAFVAACEAARPGWINWA